MAERGVFVYIDVESVRSEKVGKMGNLRFRKIKEKICNIFLEVNYQKGIRGKGAVLWDGVRVIRVCGRV